MYRFYTGYFPFSNECNPEEKVNGRGWSATYEDVNNIWNHSKTDRLQTILHAATLATASNAYNLIGAAIVAFHGDYITGTDLFPEPEDESLKKNIIDKYGAISYSQTAFSCGGIPESIRLAARASRSIDLHYALLKYRMGCSLYSLPAIEIDPYYATNHFGVLPFRESHIVIANAIVIYYSVIEQLGFQINASRENPSRLPSGEWNPSVYNDLTNRLTTAGIEVEQPVVWVQRGTKTKVVTKALKTAKTKKTPWAQGPYVRDVFVDIRDAILAASNLRSKVSSHRVDPRKIASLTPYDAENIRDVARRLLLTRLGYKCL